jgi:ribosomal subunit interface protein
MNTSIKATNVTLTPAIEDYVRKKVLLLEKLVNKDDTSARISIEIGKATEHHKSGNVFFAELNLHIAGKYFRTRRNAPDMYAAIDIAKDDLMDTLRGYKDKKTTLFRRGSQKIKDMIRGFTWRRKDLE